MSTMTAPTRTTAVEMTEQTAGMRAEVVQPLLVSAALAILTGAMVMASYFTGSTAVLLAAILPLIGASFLAVFASFRECL